MAYSNDPYNQASSSRTFHQPAQTQSQQSPLTTSPNFDILDWHPAYQSCQKYFLDHSQHEPGTQALCALINIRLPYQWAVNPIHSANPSTQSSSPNGHAAAFSFNQSARNGQSHQSPTFVSLIPYVRRLIITGFDKDGILHGFFGDAWREGIGPMQDCERRNYLFAAKHGGWRSCKKQYDLGDEQTVPFLKPLQNVVQEELEAAEKQWSSWLAMEDWMVGPRAPEDDENRQRDSQMGMHGNFGFHDELSPGNSGRSGR